MDPARLLPSSDTIPVAWGWFQFLLTLTFVLHLLLMNLMLGGGLLGLVARLRGRPGGGGLKSLPVLIALTVNLGVPPLLFVQVLFGHLLYSSSVLMAVAWILVIPLLLLAYYGAYLFTHRGGRWATLWLGLSTSLLLVVGFLFSNNMTLMLRPERWLAYFERPGGTLLNLGEPTLIPRFLHFVLASCAVAGLGWAVLHAVRQRRDGSGDPEAIRRGLRLFGWFTVAQMAIGVLFWALLPGPIAGLFLGRSAPHTAHMAVGILLALGALHFAFRGKVWPTLWMLLGTVVMMVLVRSMVRAAYLEPYFHPRELEVVGPVNPMVWFFVALLVMIGALVYMLRQAWSAAARKEGVGS